MANEGCDYCGCRAITVGIMAKVTLAEIGRNQ